LAGYRNVVGDECSILGVVNFNRLGALARDKLGLLVVKILRFLQSISPYLVIDPELFRKVVLVPRESEAAAGFGGR
jgi:hypothetical protein